MKILAQESPLLGVADDAARFYDEVAPGYDAQLGRQADLEVRQSFCELVASAAGPGGVILDFGCGTGTDAAWYAARGHRVVAYDVSPGMTDLLRERCSKEIASGIITLAVGPLETLELALAGCSPVAAIAANFAVLNHVPEPGPLLRRLALQLAPGGALFANVLNPFYRRDLLRAWWWRSAWRSRGKGAIRHDGKVVTHRHFPSAIRKAGEPDFVFEQLRAARPGVLLWALESNFLFIVLRKRS